MSRVCIFAFACVFLVGVVTGRRVRATDDLTTTEQVLIPQEVGPEVPNKLLAEQTTTEKQCAEIGQFCMSHGDCCTNACLGYMKRCVSGSG